MASIKVKFRPSTQPEREGRIFYQIIHERKTRHIPTDYRIFPNEWNDDAGIIVVKKNVNRTLHLTYLQEQIKCDIDRFERIIRRLDENASPYTTDDIVEGFKSSVSAISLFNEMEKAVARLSHNGKTRTSQAYATTLRSFRKYREENDILLDNLKQP